MKTFAFDIGIKNLAWCCAEYSDSKVTILGWANENLISGGTGESDVQSSKCSLCSKKASYSFQSSAQYCVRHCPPLTPALRDLSGCLLHTIPSMAILKAIALSKNAEKSVLKTKQSILTWLSSKVCMPGLLSKQEKVSTKKIDLNAIHDGIRRVLLEQKDLLRTSTLVLLENQPVYKNPVMKSVQMMLFATIRDILLDSGVVPSVRLVHASRKTAVEDIETGDAGYAERKSASETRVLQGFRSASIQFPSKSSTWFSEQKKRSDLADCLCMCLDSFPTPL
jgi:hypothetical protein